MSTGYSDSRRARKRRAKWRLAGMIKTAHGCIDCGYAAHAAALQFDHIENNKKSNVSDLIRSDYAWNTIQQEIDKCVIRCANCHAVITAQRRGSSSYGYTGNESVSVFECSYDTS